MDWLTNQRIRHEEQMDQPGVDPQELQRALRFIRRVNRWLGYTRSVLVHLDRFSRSWKKDQRIDILDLATGSADIPLAILDWASAKGFDIHITAIDRHPITARAAASARNDPRLRVVQADVFALPFAPASFDYCLTAMFLHHLSNEQIVHVLRQMDLLSRRGLIAADLLRHRRAYAWIWLGTLFSSRMIHHDATVSVAQALTKPEVLSLRAQAAIPYAHYHRHFGHRFVLAGEKGGQVHFSE
jgi:2-polyprenyl-3-methyl-5-hydroxy-6-metoxy-1,4-benzoquinol methylase